ncbi:MAG TPA: SDR family oxidoreductase [Gemmatimonadales bacterium]|jgi:NAD(P)-dependent dehydrogenase (short-subunit alcohol dehydrogenase family)
MKHALADLTGRVCVVTGASRGIGRATAEGLGELGARLVLVCRKAEDGAEVAAGIATAGGHTPDVVSCDLSSQASIHTAAAEILAKHPRLNVLVNNAGVLLRSREVSVDGFEMQFAVNHLGYFLLTNLLLGALKAGAPARIVNVSSGAHQGGRLDFNDLQSQRRYEPIRVYSMTKLSNILFTHELALRLEGSGVTVNAVHPGVIATRLLANYLDVPLVGGPIARAFGGKPERGAETILYLAASPEVAGITGGYFVNRQESRSSPASYDETTARRLWDVSAQLTSLA